MLRWSRIRIPIVCLTAVLTFPPAAAAQIELGWSAPAIGEAFHVEFMGGLWNPTPTLVASSDAFGIIGSSIDFGKDLGLARKQLREMRLVLKPGRKHKFRLQWVPVEYTQTTRLERRIVFRGIAYETGSLVDSRMRWDTLRLGYEYDVVSRNRWFVGLIFEAKYTQIEAELDSAFADEFARARAPIPALGAIARVYLTPYTPMTVEFTGFKWPEPIDEDYRAECGDIDIYGTLNFTRNFGVQLGYRSIDLSYLFEEDRGNLKLEGMYFAGLVRF
jgi:hypothetical protein